MSVDRQRVALVVLFVCGCGILLYSLRALRTYYGVKGAASRLPTDVSSEDILELHEAYAYGSADRRRDVCDALTHLLLTDPTYDAELTRNDIRSLLTMASQVTDPLALAILSLIEREGDESHLDALDLLVKRKRSALVREKAKSCIEAIRKRRDSDGPIYAVVRSREATEQATRSTLLRGAEKPEMTETLLHVSQAKGGGEENRQLLRSSDNSTA